MYLTTLKGDKKIWCKTAKYEVDWNRKRGSQFQLDCKTFLYPFWKRCKICEELPIPGSRLRIDLINFTKNIVVEASGNQHLEYNSHFHNNNVFVFANSLKRDLAKLEWCEKNGFLFIEIFPSDMPLSKKFFKEKYDLDLV